MPRRFSRPATVVVVAFLLVATRSAAQQSDTSAIPRELAMAVVRMNGADSTAAVELVPGRIAANVASDVAAPPNSRIVGSVVYGRTTYVFGTSTLAPDSIRAWYARDYGRRGWAGLSLVRTQGPGGMGGFRPPAPRVPTTFCNDGREYDVSIVPSPGAQTDFRVRVTTSAVPCAMVANGPVRPLTPVLPLPIVYNPPNANPGPQCFGPGGSQRTQTQLTSSLEPQALLEHYGKQLEASGWAPLQSQPPIATKAWSRRDSLGTTEIATLSVSVAPNAPMCRTATLEVATPRNR